MEVSQGYLGTYLSTLSTSALEVASLCPLSFNIPVHGTVISKYSTNSYNFSSYHSATARFRCLFSPSTQDVNARNTYHLDD